VATLILRQVQSENGASLGRRANAPANSIGRLSAIDGLDELYGRSSNSTPYLTPPPSTVVP
jgi:hypothetical protein